MSPFGYRKQTTIDGQKEVTIAVDKPAGLSFAGSHGI